VAYSKRYGSFSVKATIDKQLGNIVGQKIPHLVLTFLNNLAGLARNISPTDQLIESAELIGICLCRPIK
jgi:hypothetical protein